jgi:hypothetical protein
LPWQFEENLAGNDQLSGNVVDTEVPISLLWGLELGTVKSDATPVKSSLPITHKFTSRLRCLEKSL